MCIRDRHIPVGYKIGVLYRRARTLGVRYLLALKLQLHVEQKDARLVEALRLLLEPGIAEGLLEGHARHEEAVGYATASDLLYAHLKKTAATSAQCNTQTRSLRPANIQRDPLFNSTQQAHTQAHTRLLRLGNMQRYA